MITIWQFTDPVDMVVSLQDWQKFRFSVIWSQFINPSRAALAWLSRCVKTVALIISISTAVLYRLIFRMRKKNKDTFSQLSPSTPSSTTFSAIVFYFVSYCCIQQVSVFFLICLFPPGQSHTFPPPASYLLPLFILVYHSFLVIRMNWICPLQCKQQ